VEGFASEILCKEFPTFGGGAGIVCRFGVAQLGQDRAPSFFGLPVSGTVL
jgi:hypothetical protein